MQTQTDNKNKDNNMAWDRVKNARKQNRPETRDFIREMVTDFYEVNGDRCLGDDKAIVTGVGRINGRVVTIIGQQKGHTIAERKACHFGMPYPAGYRKSMRAIKQAEKFNRPIICLIDTPGAFCGVKAEEQGQGTVIAQHLRLIAAASVPVIAVVIGEGGSGGALALAISDRLIVLENTYFSVISPEGCASILFKDASKAELAARSLCLTPEDLVRMKIADCIISEKEEYTATNMDYTVKELMKKLDEYLDELVGFSSDELIEKRYDKILLGGIN